MCEAVGGCPFLIDHNRNKNNRSIRSNIGNYRFALYHELDTSNFLLEYNDEKSYITIEQMNLAVETYFLPNVEKWYREKYYTTWNIGFYIGIAGFIVSLVCLIYLLGINIKQIIYNRPETKEDFYEP
jgi:hypothetical protein